MDLEHTATHPTHSDRQTLPLRFLRCHFGIGYSRPALARTTQINILQERTSQHGPGSTQTPP